MLNFLKQSKKILGINERNLKYLSYSKKKKKIVDEKLETKKLLKKHKLPFPKTLAVIKSFKDLINFNFEELPESFVLKPNQGYGGAGILIVFSKKTNEQNQIYWIKSNKTKITQDWIKNHIIHILEGRFSLNNKPDIAFFEERIKIPKFLKSYSYAGIPDIRLIIYNSVVVMAMLRLPTKLSEGKANLHLGGVGVGIDLASGKTTSAVFQNKIIQYLPETKFVLRGIQIPNWKEILKLAIMAQMATKIKYVAIDIAIDRERGPLILELNARPGLNIQLANLAPLKERLERVEGLKINNYERGVILSQQLFGTEFEEQFIEEISGKRIIGINEPIEILGDKNNIFKTIAKIDTGAYRTAICSSIAEKINILKPIKFKKVRSALGIQKRPIIKLSFILDKKPINTEAFVIDRSELKFDVLIGRKDLKQFLIDPKKHAPIIKKLTIKKENLLIGKIIYKIKGKTFYIIEIKTETIENFKKIIKHFLKKIKKIKGKILIEISNKENEKIKILESLNFFLKEKKENTNIYQIN